MMLSAAEKNLTPQTAASGGPGDLAGATSRMLHGAAVRILLQSPHTHPDQVEEGHWRKKVFAVADRRLPPA